MLDYLTLKRDDDTIDNNIDREKLTRSRLSTNSIVNLVNQYSKQASSNIFNISRCLQAYTRCICFELIKKCN